MIIYTERATALIDAGQVAFQGPADGAITFNSTGSATRKRARPSTRRCHRSRPRRRPCEEAACPYRLLRRDVRGRAQSGSVRQHHHMVVADRGESQRYDPRGER